MSIKRETFTTIIAITVSLLVLAYYYRQQAAALQKGEANTAQQPALKADNNTVTKVHKDQLSAPKTATLRLPEKTNNIWQMKPFELPATDGKKHSLADWKGKVILLNFWASWCAPCQFEIPRFVRYQKNYSDKGLQIVGIGLDELNKLKNVERSLEINYPSMVVPQINGAPLLEKFGNDQGIVPYTVVIDKNGTITYIHRGTMEDEDFNDYVLPLLGS